MTLPRHPDVANGAPRVCVVSASGQNVFFEELLSALASGLSDHGVTVERAVDHFPSLRDDLVYLFVPHEFIPLTQVASHPTPRQLARSVAICTEQPGTVWFEEAARIAQDAGAAVDINELGVAALSERGIPAGLVRLGYVPEWDHWGGSADRDRPVDMIFMGGTTVRREQALARCGSVLRHHTAEIHLVETHRPHTVGNPHFLAGARKWDALRDAKVMLNVHRSELAYMEWLRTLGAILNGSVVVTEHSLGYAPLVPDRHFVSAGFDALHLAVGAVLQDERRLHDIRHAAYALVRDEMPMSASIEALRAALDEAASNPVSTPDPGEPTPAPRPKPMERPPRRGVPPQDMDVVRMGLKHLILETRALRSELHSMRHVGEESPQDTIEITEPYANAAPTVSVVVTLFNYAEYVGEALTSVARSDHRAYEVIVIDDASSDHSVDVVRETLSRHPWVPAKLIVHGRNQGLAAARNRGIAEARGDYVFVLDADNAIYPHALSVLERTLDADPEAAFAYGIIERFDTSGPIGLMSYLDWSPERLADGNYIDAMAMIRRDALDEVGGYTSEAILHGWEDFALWCALASDGYRGLAVPTILSRYRVGLFSMISVTNIDATSAWAALTRRFSVLRA